MSIIGKSASALIKAANNGNIGMIDKLANSIASLDMSKVKELSREKKKKASDFTNLSKEAKQTRNEKRDAQSKMNEYVNLYDEMVTVADEINVKVAIENDVKPFTATVLYRTSNEMTKTFGTFKKVFNALSSEINDFQDIKKEYTNIIMRIKQAERDALSENRNVQTLERKIIQLNTSIENLKK